MLLRTLRSSCLVAQLLCLAILITPAHATAESPTVPAEPFETDCVGPPASMVGWWTFDESSGKTAFDLIGGHNGIHLGGPLPEPAAVSNGLVFDGVDDYVEIADASTLDLGKGDLSITAWIRTRNSSGVRTILDKRSFSPGFGFVYGYHLFLYQGRLGLQLADGTFSNYVSSTSLADGKFHHIAVTVNRDPFFGPVGIVFYVDGVGVGTANPTARPGALDNGAPLRIGASSGPSPTFHWDGVIDEVELFDRVLDSGEIGDIAAAGHSGKCKCATLSCRPAAWWTFDEVEGGRVQDIADHFSGPHDGTVLEATPTFGRVDGALWFDGIDDQVVVEDDTGLDLDLRRSGQFTVMAWLRTTEPTGPIVTRRFPGPTDIPSGWALYLDQGRPSFGLTTLTPFRADSSAGGTCDSAACTALDLADDRWHLIGATVAWDAGGDNTLVRLFADGRQVQAFGPVELDGVLGGSTLRIGAEIGRPGTFYRGTIDEPQIFREALTEAAFSSIFAAGRAGECRPAKPPQVCGRGDSENCPAGQFCDFLAASRCGESPVGGLCRAKPEVCITLLDPVCGCDGQTYSNSCFANAAGVSVVSPGPCQ